jgi:outer membrane protein assembly factor BamB
MTRLHAVINTCAIWKSQMPTIHTLVANELIFFGNESGGFYAVDFRGEMKWRFQAKRAVTSSPTIKRPICLLFLGGWALLFVDAKTAGRLEFRLGKGSVSSPNFG